MTEEEKQQDVLRLATLKNKAAKLEHVLAGIPLEKGKEDRMRKLFKGSFLRDLMANGEFTPADYEQVIFLNMRLNVDPLDSRLFDSRWLEFEEQYVLVIQNRFRHLAAYFSQLCSL